MYMYIYNIYIVPASTNILIVYTPHIYYICYTHTHSHIYIYTPLIRRLLPSEAETKDARNRGRVAAS